MKRHLLPLAICISIASGTAIFVTPSYAQRLEQRQKVEVTKALTAADLSMSDECYAQFQALIAEKDSRTPAQCNIDSQFLYSAKLRRSDPLLSSMKLQVKAQVPIDMLGRFLTDIRATVSPELVLVIQSSGGQVLEVNAESNFIRAWYPVDNMEWLAERNDIQFIGQPAMPFHNTGSVTGVGDFTHDAGNYTGSPARIGARTIYGTTGSGQLVGVLSDSNTKRAQSQSTGDLPPSTGAEPTMQDISGQTGSSTSAEGTAMSEIVYDIAPGAGIRFATADTSDVSFADNIRSLKAAGCKVIVDDVFYFNEPPFADGVINKAIDDVTADGTVLYFSSAGNQGNQGANSSSVWEGDFNNGGTAPSPFPSSRLVHRFGAGASGTYDTILNALNDNPVILFWSDPQSASSNDYDLYEVNSAGSSIIAASSNVQDGNDDPIEGIGPTFAAGERLYIIAKTTAQTRALHLNTFNGTGANSPDLAFNTNGQTHGHSSARNAFSVAAAPAPASAGGPFPNAFTSTSRYEYFTSDGPRRVFYTANGAIGSNTYTSALIGTGTPTFAGTAGETRLKPDLMGADGAASSAAFSASSGLNPFFGTSAAAPHAAAIAALVIAYKSVNATGAANVPLGVTIDGSKFTAAQLRQILIAGSIDNTYSGGAVGWDSNTGYGILMPKQALAFVTAFANPNGTAVTSTNTSATLTWTTALSADSIVEYGTTSGVYSQSATGASGTSHIVTLTGLTPQTGYFYRVRSKTGATDATSGAIFVGPERSFATGANATSPKIIASAASVSSAGGTATVNLTLKNTGSATATNVSIISATLSGTSTNTTLPTTPVTVAVNGTTVQSLAFPGATPGLKTLTVSGTYAGAGFNITISVRVP